MIGDVDDPRILDDPEPLELATIVETDTWEMAVIDPRTGKGVGLGQYLADMEQRIDYRGRWVATIMVALFWIGFILLCGIAGGMEVGA